MPSKETLQFDGHLHFRQRFVMSTLSGKPIKISNIRPDADHPGLCDFEASFIRLLEKVTNGSHIEINYTGTSVFYSPGVIVGGKITHDCKVTRALGYFLEPMIQLAPFAKHPLELTLSGITNDNIDVGVDLIRTVLLPQLTRFGIEDGLELKVLKRGARPLGGGQVLLSVPNVRQLKPVQFIDQGLVKKIRGIAYCTRISPQMANRMQEASRSILTRFIPDVYIYTDVYKGPESGLSPGFALSLVAETDTQAFYSSECAFQARQTLENNQGKEDILENLVNDYSFPTPEDLAVRATRQLMTEIKKGGTVDTISQSLNLLLIVLGPEDVGKIRVGSLTTFTIQYLRDLERFFGLKFKITPEKETGTVLLSSVGIGYVNVNKAVS